MARKYKQRQRSITAETADRHKLYQLAVQCVESEIDMVDQTYREIRGQRANKLREDFCGTGNTSCEWVQRRRANTAIGFDLDTEVLNWGHQNNIAKLNPSQQSRVQLVQQDVLTAAQTTRSIGLVDIVIAMNFSYFLFTTREQLRSYFVSARAGLADDGILMLDSYGGHKSWRNLKEKTKCAGFTYVWEQRKFNPITSEFRCYIHFKFADGSQIKRAFRYDWRMWTLPEIRELLGEAGFTNSTVYWEGTDEKTGQGNDIYSPAEQGEDDPSWIVYIVAEK